MVLSRKREWNLIEKPVGLDFEFVSKKRIFLTGFQNTSRKKESLC